jgi:hypothetical protein
MLHVALGIDRGYSLLSGELFDSHGVRSRVDCYFNISHVSYVFDLRCFFFFFVFVFSSFPDHWRLSCGIAQNIHNWTLSETDSKTYADHSFLEEVRVSSPFSLVTRILA